MPAGYSLDAMSANVLVAFRPLAVIMDRRPNVSKGWIPAGRLPQRKVSLAPKGTLRRKRDCFDNVTA